eukprot:Opistho-2@77238
MRATTNPDDQHNRAIASVSPGDPDCLKDTARTSIVRHRMSYLNGNASLWHYTYAGRIPIDSTCVGNYQRGTWDSTRTRFQPGGACMAGRFNGSDALECLGGKWVVLTGDSNSVNLFDAFTSLFAKTKTFLGKTVRFNVVRCLERELAPAKQSAFAIGGCDLLFFPVRWWLV